MPKRLSENDRDELLAYLDYNGDYYTDVEVMWQAVWHASQGQKLHPKESAALKKVLADYNKGEPSDKRITF